MKNIIRVFSVFLLTGLLLTACQSTGAPVLTYGDSVITENQFTYYLATYKASFLSSYADMSDTKEFYGYVLPNGQTGEEFLFGETVNNVCLSLICGELFDQNGLQLDSAVTEAVDAYIQTFIEDYAGGDKRVLNSELSEFGLNVNMLRDIYLLEEKGTALYEYLYGDQGTIGVTAEALDTYYRENYVRIRHIYVNNAYAYETTADGYTARDEDGYYLTRALTEEETVEKEALLEKIDAALAAGEDFEAVYEAYSEDQYYKNGYYINSEMDFIEEVKEAAFALEVGAWTKVESEVGTHYILRLDFDERPWENTDNADFFDGFTDEVRFAAFVAYIRERIPDVVKDEERLGAFSVEDSPANYRF